MSDQAKPLFEPGQQVRRRSSRDQVGAITSAAKRVAAEWWYPVFFGGHRVVNIPESDLELHSLGKSIEDLLLEGIYASKETFSKLITFTKLQSPLRDNLLSVRATRTQFLHYQFKPLLKFLDSSKQRLLIADEVGLGKTIEAGLILVEMRARHPESLDRVLVVCPSALCTKWRMEMKTRFDEEFRILDSADVRQFLEDFDLHGETTKLRGICSLQTLRGKTVLEDWEAVSPPLDLMIVDEAHHLRNPDTLSHRMARALAENADSVILLTATPIHIGNVNLFYLLRVLDPEQFGTNPVALRDEVGEILFQRLIRANEPVVEALRAFRATFPPDLTKPLNLLQQAASGPEGERFKGNPLYGDVLRRLSGLKPWNRREVVEIQRDLTNLNLLNSVLTRTRKRDVEARTVREARVLRRGWTTEEQDIYDAVTQYVLDRYNALRGDPFAAFLTMMPQRQVASCIPAVVERYENDVVQPAGGIESELSDLQVEDWSNGTESATEPPPPLDLQSVITRWRQAGSPDTKFQLLLDGIQGLDEIEAGRKILIFAYFKPTLHYLSRRFSELDYRSELISGDYTDEERQEAIRRFREDPKTRILLSSEVGSEGLDFQFCHIVVNYDLPWNPMVVEQRIGRLDRIGQQSPKILIFNFSIPGTIEDRILTRLYQRIRIFQESVGDLEPIIGEEIKSLTRDLLSSQLSNRQKDERINQIAEVLERRRQELEELEEHSSRFIGQDEFFSEEIDRVLKRKRYMSAEEIRIFLREFLDARFPECTFEPVSPMQYELKVTNELERFVADRISSDEPALLEFRRRCSRGTVRITFDSDEALQVRDIDFVTAHHPLVRAIARYYEENPQDLHPVARVLIRGGAALGDETTYGIPSGEYFYFIYKIEVQGARHERTLRCVFVSPKTGLDLDENVSEDLLAAMVTVGETLDTIPDYGPQEAARMQAKADSVLGDHIQRRKQELSKLNEGIVNSRLVSLEQSFMARISRKEQQLTHSNAKDTPPNFIRMLEGAVRRLRSDYERRKEEIEWERQLDIVFERVAAGVVRVE